MSSDHTSVVIFQFAYPLFNNPSIINFANVLAEHGYRVEIFTDSTQPDRFVHDGSDRIAVHVLGVPEWEQSPAPTGGGGSRLARRLKRALRAALPMRAQLAIVTFRNELRWLGRLARYARRCARTLPAGARTVFVGSEVYGLAVAAALGLLRRTPVIYWSFELNLWRDRGGFRARATKLLEWVCHRRAALTITQDVERARLLALDNGVDVRSFCVVPATARGRARSASTRSTYLRDRLGIGHDRKIALYAGTITDWALCEELAAAAPSWPDPWVLVLHGWGGGQYLRRLQARAERSSKVYLSLDFVPLSELDTIIASADAGLALYRERNTNSRLIAAASNKLGHYLRSGLATVTSDVPGLRRVAEEYGCIVPVGSADEVGKALAQIGADPDGFRARALHCYEALYDFDAYIGAVLTRLDSLAA